MSRQQVIFHGDAAEQADLLKAISHWCNNDDGGGGNRCKFDPVGQRIETCSAHQALVDDQRFVDGLVFIRRLKKKLLEEEDRGLFERDAR